MIGATLVQDPEKIKQALDSILGRPEFSRLNRQDLREIIKKIFEKMGKVELFRSNCPHHRRPCKDFAGVSFKPHRSDSGAGFFDDPPGVYHRVRCYCNKPPYFQL